MFTQHKFDQPWQGMEEDKEGNHKRKDYYKEAKYENIKKILDLKRLK